MLNIIATPPSRAPRLPSLEPFPLASGTTGVHAASLGRFRRPPTRQPSPLAESSSEEECGEKLDALIGSMEDVIQGYAGYPTRAPTYLAALHGFHQRALNLKVPPDDTLESPFESSCGECPDEGYFPRQTSAHVLRDLSPTHPNHPRQSPRQVAHTSHNEPINTSQPPCNQHKPSPYHPASLSPPIEQVKQLAREWWNSEVAAAWYGPRPRARPSRSPTSPKRKHSAEEERERLRASLEDLDVRSSGHLERGPAFARQRSVKMEKDREQNIKRESSFVGLNDE